MPVAYAVQKTSEAPKVRVGRAFDTARQFPDNPAWAAVVAQNANDLAIEARDLRTRMAKGEGTPLRLVDFKKHMK